MSSFRILLIYTAALSARLATAQIVAPAADLGQRTAGQSILPEQFLRGYDPVTAYFPADVVGQAGPADDGPRRLKIAPDWPGAWVWVDKRTLQFRPAEPWPALQRFAFDMGSAKRVLTTMMSAPSAMAPTPGSEGLKPFRVITLTFAQSLPASSLKKMLTFELRDLPGLSDSPRRKLSSYSLAPLPRANQRDPMTWSVTFDDDIPEGKQLVASVSLALGNEGTTLWQGRVATRARFALTAIRCGSAEFSLLGGGSTPKDAALGCGNRGDQPQLVFSSQLTALTLTQLRQLVRFEPAVPKLGFTLYGSRVQLTGAFVPDTLYSMTLGSSSLVDDTGRALQEVRPATVYFHLGWKASFLRFNQGTMLLEAKGPRVVPISGYGETKADVRIYRVDPQHPGLWPWPNGPLTLNEATAPPFPGEEPELPAVGSVQPEELERHLRLLGSPLVSRLVDIPLANRSGTTTFGLDLKPLLDGAVGPNRPGTYLVGLRRLAGRPERAWVRAQVTNLSLTAVEETAKAVFYIRTIDTAAPVAGATVRIDGRAKNDTDKTVQATATTDGQGRVTFSKLTDWASLERVVVSSGEDTLVVDPREHPPTYRDNHWSGGNKWLHWLTDEPPPSPNDTTVGFVFTERPIYKPGEPVFIKAFVRRKETGQLKIPVNLKAFSLKVSAPDGTEWPLQLTLSPLGGLAATFAESAAPTGELTVSLMEGPALVASRSFKIEAYRIPTFEVQLAGPARTRNDSPFKVTALARYFAGGNLSEQPISWSVTQRPWVWVPASQPGFLFASSTQFSRSGPARVPEVVKQEATLDDSGGASISMNPQLDLDGSARVYHFEATVTGPDDQPITNATEVKVLPPFILGLKVPRYLEKATSLSPEVVAIGVDNKPIKNQEIQLKVMRRVWHSTLQETSFATGQAKYTTSQEDIKVAEKMLVSGETPVSHAVPVAESGIYIVELTARDKLGRVQTLSADLYIGGQSPQAWPKSREGVFELKPDKEAYAPGEIAHVVVQSPYTAAKALVIIEAPTGNRYEWREVAGGKTVIDVDLTERHTPNLPVHVVLMRGRLGEGKADDARYRPATSAASIELEVAPVRNTVNVALGFAETAKPGTTVDVSVTLSDEAKKPLGGEVTLWLVDEAVLSLAKEATLSPLDTLIQRNRATSSVRDTRSWVVGRVSEQEDEPGGDGDDSDGDSKKRIVRKEFKTVPYYAATLTVPATGKLTVPVKLSDDLTNFRVRAVAVSQARFGVKQGTLKVRLPVLVQPQAPRFVRMGDSFFAGGVARLVEGAEGPASVDIKALGPIDGPASNTQRVELKNNKAASVVLPFSVKPVALGTATSLTLRVDVTRLADKAGDAFEVKLPVLPDRAEERSVSTVTLQPGTSQLPGLPEPARASTTSQTVIFTNQPGVLELAQGLDYLSAYPHGCLEQRMSQVAPDLQLAGLLKRLELDTRFTPQLTRTTRALLDELAQHQDEAGYLGYWPGSVGDVQMTASALEFIGLAKKAGIATDETVRQRTIAALKRALRSDAKALTQDYRAHQQTAALKALASAGELDDNYLLELFAKRSSFDAVTLADLTSAFASKQNTYASNLSTLSTDLWDRVVLKLVRGKPTFDGIRGDRPFVAPGFLGSSPATTAAVWEALLKVDAANSKHQQLRDALLSQASWRGFGSTYANRRALSALGTWLESASTPQPKTAIAVAGATAVSLDENKKAARRVLNTDAALGVTVSGGPVTARVQQRFVPLGAGDTVVAKRDGLIVSRSVTRVFADGTAPKTISDTPGAVTAVALGEVLEVHARLESNEVASHVALVVPLAAGTEPLNPALATASSDAKPTENDSLKPTSVQRLDHEVRYYFTQLPRGTHTFHFRVRASTEGRFVVPAPYAELMYREEVRGRGDGTRLTVTGAHQK